MLQAKYIDCQGQHFSQQQQASSSISPEILISVRKIEARKGKYLSNKIIFLYLCLPDMGTDTLFRVCQHLLDC